MLWKQWFWKTWGDFWCHKPISLFGVPNFSPWITSGSKTLRVGPIVLTHRHIPILADQFPNVYWLHSHVFFCHIFIYIYTYISIHVYLYTYNCTYIYIYIHTYTIYTLFLGYDRSFVKSPLLCIVSPSLLLKCLSNLYRYIALPTYIYMYWFVVWNRIFFSHNIWECHHPNWLSYFSEGLEPPTIYIYICIYIYIYVCMYVCVYI